MVIVLSHGKTDLLYASDMSYNPEFLWDSFTPEKCSDLAGKPKIFLIQVIKSLFLETNVRFYLLRRINL